MQWSETTGSRGVLEQGFRLEVDGRDVPGVLWRAEGGAENAPLVLIGHGGTQHKRTGYVLSLARMLARHHGIASFAYPYGRTWDYDDETRSILQELGFRSAATAMPGLNDADTPKLELKRTAVNESSDLAQIMCEVDGVFRWLDRRGVNLRA